LQNRPRFLKVVLAVALALLAVSAQASAVKPTPLPSNLALKSINGYAVYGVTDTIATVLQFTTLRPLDGVVQLGDGRRIDVAPDTSPILSFAPLGTPNIGAVKVTGTNVDGSTFVTFKSPAGARVMGFEIPILTQKVADAWATTEIRQLTNPSDGSFATSLLLFNVSPEPAWVTATIYDDAHPNKPAAREYILTDPNGVLTWYDLQTKFDSGRVELRRGITSGFGCLGCDPRGEVYGFAVIGAGSGDAPRVRPIIAKEPLAIFLP
jgi:hypothetical protein